MVIKASAVNSNETKIFTEWGNYIYSEDYLENRKNDEDLITLVQDKE
jgi:hypothetical protein